jgi:hypothetical protein
MWNPLGVTNHTLSWRPEPTTRGTWSLISSCIATIGLCVWTAVHLNVPEHGRTGKHVWRKVKWVIISLIAPEIVRFLTPQILIAFELKLTTAERSVSLPLNNGENKYYFTGSC